MGLCLRLGLAVFTGKFKFNNVRYDMKRYLLCTRKNELSTDFVVYTMLLLLNREGAISAPLICVLNSFLRKH